MNTESDNVARTILLNYPDKSIKLKLLLFPPLIIYICYPTTVLLLLIINNYLS